MSKSSLFFPKSLEQSLEIVENLIISLSHFLKIQKENIRDIIATVIVTHIRENLEPEDKDFLRILAIRINLTNTTNKDKFICFS